MANTVLDSIEHVLSQVQSELTKQVETVSALVREAELAEELIRAGREQIALSQATLARTQQLQRSVNEQRAILATLRETLRAICGPSSRPQ
jgi:hypothetical protein